MRPLGALRARHSVQAVEIRDPREMDLPAVGHLSLVDPETGALVEVDSSRPGLRKRFADAARQEREAVASELQGPARRPRRALHRGRLAARAREGSCGELRIARSPPRALRDPGDHRDLRARPAPPAQVRRALHGGARARGRHGLRRRVALAPPSPRRAAPRGARGAARRAGQAADDRRRAGGEGVGHARHRPVRARCAPTTCRPRAWPPPSRPRATSSRRSRRSCRSGRCRSPTCRSRSSPPSTDRDDVRSLIDGLVADGGTAAGDALQSALDALDDAGVGGKGRPPAAIILLSDGATTTGADPVEVAREAGKRDIPIYTVALGTPDGTVPGGFGGSIPVPPDPETLQRDLQGLRRHGLHGQRRRPALRRVREPRVAPRHEAGGARDHGRLRRRRAHPAARRGVRRAAHHGPPAVARVG